MEKGQGKTLVEQWNMSDKAERIMFVRVLCRLYGDVVREELARVKKGGSDGDDRGQGARG